MKIKTKFVVALIAVSLAVGMGSTIAAESDEIATELKDVITKIQTKLRAGEKSEAALAEEINAFDAILAKHKGEKTDEVAQVMLMKASLYSQVLDNEAKGKEIMDELKREFPDTKAVAMLKRQEEAEKIRADLVVGKAFPAFEVKDTDGKPLALSAFKGKVVLIDFWATWCGPCVAELPNVLEAYEKHHDAGFEIIGISLDSDKEKLTKFVADKKMTWVQFFDGNGWQNELAQKYGVNSIPSTYLLDREGKIIGVGLRGSALEKAVAAALAAK